MRRGLILLAVAGVACGSPGEPADPARIEVPPQPPQLVATTAPADASAPVAAAPEVPFTCEGAGLKMTVGKRGYCAYSDPLPWIDAEKRCVSRGGHLVSLPSRAVIEAVHRAYGNELGVFARAAWIGLEVVNKSKKQWKWSTGEPVKFDRWNDGEPNDFDGHESCGELLTVNGRWNDTRCELQQGYLCQAAAKKPLDCGDGGKPVGGEKYCYVAQASTYAEAKKACAKRGGALASVTSEEISKEIQAGLEQRFKVPRFWIGLNDLAEQGTWTWADGKPLTSAHWKPGEPNNFGREGCVELFTDSWTWNDLDCAVELPSLCEAKP
jgi:hypothetical protein